MNVSQETDDYTDYSEYKAGTYLWKIFPPILIILGTTGNILSIIVLRRPNIRKSVCSNFFVVLAVSDLVVLYTGLLRQWISMTFDVDIRSFGSGICKLHTWIVYCSLDFSSWILVAVTIERLGLVWFPHKTKTRCTKKLASISLVVTEITLMLVNCHILYGIGDVNKNNNGTVVLQKCSIISDSYSDFWSTKWPWIDLAVFCGAPFFCLLFGNIFIFIKVMISRRAIKRKIVPATTTTGTASKNDGKLSSMSIMLFTTNTMFLICTTPISVYLIGYDTWSISVSTHGFAVLDMMWAIVNILMYANNSINFLLYVLSGSRFRREFKDIFKRKENNVAKVQKQDSATKIQQVSVIQSNNVDTPGKTANTSL